MKISPWISGAALLFASSFASAMPFVQVYEWAITPGQAPAVVAAFDALQSSEVGKNRRAQVQLQAVAFNGASPTTHRVVALWPSVAEAEAWSQGALASEEIALYTARLNQAGTPVATYSVVPLRNWGTVSSEDRTWDVIQVEVSNPGAILAGLDALLNDKETQAFPGQIWLVQVLTGQAGAAGRSTHEIVVGYESLAEMEAWQETLLATDAWKKWSAVAGANMKLVNRSFAQWVRFVEHSYDLEAFAE